MTIHGPHRKRVLDETFEENIVLERWEENQMELRQARRNDAQRRLDRIINP